MSRILVVYSTTDGHTAKVAREIGVALREAGADAHVLIARPGMTDLSGYDAVIVAASLHGGRFQRAVRRWVHASRDVLQRKPSAFVAVCLMVRNPSEKAQRGLAEIIERFVGAEGWRPTWIKPVAGALPYTRYSWLKRFVMKRIAARTGNDTDTTRDFDYTDWPAVRAFAAGIAASVAGKGHPDLRGAA
jgi:menaquinone-dependent protoporphyrinogen oxidase